MRFSTFLVAGAMLAGATIAMVPTQAHAGLCAPAGAASDCNYVITVNANNTISGAIGASTSPYDGSDDAYVGVVNNSATFILTGLHLVGHGNGGGIFAFDNDGVCNGHYTLTAAVCAPSTGYAGPTTTFSNISMTTVAKDTGDVNFGPGLAPGAFTFFSLESDPGTFSGGGIIITPTPEPVSIALLGAGLAGLGLVRRRKA